MVSRDKLWRVMQYGIVGRLLTAIKSLYCQSGVCVYVNDKQSKSFHVSVSLRQGCGSSPPLFIIYVNWMNKLGQTDERVTIGKCKISRLLFTENLILLASAESGHYHELNGLAPTCDIDEIKISTSRNEILHLLRNPSQCFLQVGGV